MLAPDAFAAALAGIPSEDWSRTWAADRTIALRRTSKRVKEVVDKMRLPAVVCLSRSFWDDTHNDTGEAKQQFVLRQLATMTERCLITTLALPTCDIRENVWTLAGVLKKCSLLPHLDLSFNLVRCDILEIIGGSLPQCTVLTHLNLSGNRIRNGRAESFAALGRCTALAHLDLEYNEIGLAGADRLVGVLGQCSALAHLNLSHNDIGAAGIPPQ